MCVLRCIGSPSFVGMLVKFNCMIVNARANIFFTAAFCWLLLCLRILMKIKRYHLTCFVDTFLLKLRYDEVPPQWVKNTYIIFSLQNQPKYHPTGQSKPAQVAAWWVKNKHIFIAKPTQLPPRRIKIHLFSFPNQDKYPHPAGRMGEK